MGKSNGNPDLVCEKSTKQCWACINMTRQITLNHPSLIPWAKNTGFTFMLYPQCMWLGCVPYLRVQVYLFSVIISNTNRSVDELCHIALDQIIDNIFVTTMIVKVSLKISAAAKSPDIFEISANGIFPSTANMYGTRGDRGSGHAWKITKI